VEPQLHPTCQQGQHSRGCHHHHLGGGVGQDSCLAIHNRLTNVIAHLLSQAGEAGFKGVAVVLLPRMIEDRATDHNEDRPGSLEQHIHQLITTAPRPPPGVSMAARAECCPGVPSISSTSPNTPAPLVNGEIRPFTGLWVGR